MACGLSEILMPLIVEFVKEQLPVVVRQLEALLERQGVPLTDEQVAALEADLRTASDRFDAAVRDFLAGDAEKKEGGRDEAG